MKKTTKTILFFTLGTLISNTALHADRIDHWKNATTAQKTAQLKERITTELEKLHVTNRAQRLFESQAPLTTNGWFSLMEGKEVFERQIIHNDKGLVPFIKQLSSEFPSSNLLLNTLNTCHNTGKAIISLINLYNTTKKHFQNLPEPQKQHHIKNAIMHQVESLDRDLLRLTTDHAKLKKEFYLSSDKKAAKDLLLFLNERLQDAINNIKISFARLHGIEEGEGKEAEEKEEA